MNIKVIKRKLGRERYPYGQALTDKKIIEVDERGQTDKDYLNTIIHEAVHCLFPKMKEEQVRRIADRIEKLIWSQGYRSKNGKIDKRIKKIRQSRRKEILKKIKEGYYD